MSSAKDYFKGRAFGKIKGTVLANWVESLALQMPVTICDEVVDSTVDFLITRFNRRDEYFDFDIEVAGKVRQLLLECQGKVDKVEALEKLEAAEKEKVDKEELTCFMWTGRDADGEEISDEHLKAAEEVGARLGATIKQAIEELEKSIEEDQQRVFPEALRLSDGLALYEMFDLAWEFGVGDTAIGLRVDSEGTGYVELTEIEKGVIGRSEVADPTRDPHFTLSFLNPESIAVLMKQLATLQLEMINARS